VWHRKGEERKEGETCPGQNHNKAVLLRGGGGAKGLQKKGGPQLLDRELKVFVYYEVKGIKLNEEDDWDGKKHAIGPRHQVGGTGKAIKGGGRGKRGKGREEKKGF